MLMREKSVDFCYSEDDDDQSNCDNQTVSGGNNFHDTLFFSPVGKQDELFPQSLSPASTTEKKKRENIGFESTRARQVLACGDESDISLPCAEELKEAAKSGRYGSLHIPGVDRDDVYLDLSEGDKSERQRMMEGILADQSEAERILTRHRGEVVEREPTPRAWLDTTPMPPPFVSPVRAQQMEDTMNSAIDQMERSLVDF